MKNKLAWMWVAWACAGAPGLRAEETLPVTFRLHAPAARSAAVVGEFNGWITNALPMQMVGTGEWTASTRLPAGDYGYKFVVDGRWIFDPSQPARKFVDQLENSRLVVRAPVFNNSAAPAAAAPSASPPPQGNRPAPAWDHGSYQRSASRYNDALASYQQYLQKRVNPGSLRTIESSLHAAVDDLARIEAGAPSKYNVQGLIDRCNKLLFDVHATMQVSR